ncbi:MAG: hypothetical protein Q8O67_03110 [Deltaproteobacteria bacterium]|nr:hypothetical protein [Deltaproteobacteria bacterium]
MKGVLTLAALASSTACFPLDRTDGLLPGDVVGRAVHEDGGGVAAGARITPDGATARVVRAKGDGTFVVRGLAAGSWVLRFDEDEDGDGRAERAGFRAINLVASIPVGGTEPLLGAVLLGDVALGGVVAVNGSVVRADARAPSTSTRAFVLRRPEELSEIELAGVARTQLQGQEAGADADIGIAVDDDGSTFSIVDVAPGAFRVIAFDPGTQGSEKGDTPAAMSAPAVVSAVAGGNVDVGELELVAVVGSRPVGIATALAPGVLPGAPLIVTVVRAGGNRENPDDVVIAVPLDVAAVLQLDVPFGVFDVFVDNEGGAEFHGVLLAQIVYPAAAGEPANLAWGPMALTAVDPCAPVAASTGLLDRDNDGLAGLPAHADAPEVYVRCAASCAVSGPGLANASCDLGGDRFDCDDDADGQADPRELGCVGLCSGSDRDEDGVCDRNDPAVEIGCAPNCEQPDAGVVVDAGPEPDAGPGRLGCSAPRALPLDGVAAGTLIESGADDVDACFDLGAVDTVFSFSTPGGLATLNASLGGSSFDTVLSVYAGECAGAVSGLTQLGCNDDSGGPTSLVQATDVPAGEVFVVVEGYRGDVGDFRLSLDGTYANGALCDPARTSLSCPGGACAPDGTGNSRCLPPRDCADTVPIDADDDGSADEDAASCVNAPVVTCPANFASAVLAPAALSATASDPGDDGGAVVARRWSIVESPFGSTVALDGATTDDVRFTPLLAGRYLLRYVAADDVGQLSACEVEVLAETDDVFRVELLWNVDVAAGDPTDLDVHLLHPTAPAWFDGGLDCHYLNCRAGNLSWSQFANGGPDPSASLDIDDRDGRGPENVNITNPEETGNAYRIGVHYFADDGAGPATAFVNVFCFGQLAATLGPVTLTTDADSEANDLWKVADVSFASSSCTVTALEESPGTALVVPTSLARQQR